MSSPSLLLFFSNPKPQFSDLFPLHTPQFSFLHPPPKNNKMFSFPLFRIFTIHFLLLFQTLSFSSVSSTSNATSIYEVLHNHGLPMGLFPKGINEFEVAEDGRFWVHLDQACNAKFENELHYDRNVSGLISYGKIDGLTGLEAQDLFLWFPVMSIRVDVPSSGLIYFDVGAAFKQFSLSLFETPPDCVAVGSENDDHAHVDEGQSGRLRYKLDKGTSGRDVL